ncbi:hypothetical protein ES703_04447 [subsurface metagenome]
MAGSEEGKRKIIKFKLVGEEKGKKSSAPAGAKVSFKIPGVAKTGAPKLKLKILGERAPTPLRRLEGAPGVTTAALREIKDMLEDMNKYQKRITELEKQYDEEEDKRLVAEGELKALKPQLEEAKEELKSYRQMEKEYLGLQQRYEKLSKEKTELEAMYARDDLKHLKEALYAADGYLDRLKRDLKEGRISEKGYEIKSKQLLKDKWDAQHKMLVLEDILKKAIAKTELVAASKERRAKELKLVKKALEVEKPKKAKEKEAPLKEREKPKKVEKKAERRERKAVPA